MQLKPNIWTGEKKSGAPMQPVQKVHLEPWGIIDAD